MMGHKNLSFIKRYIKKVKKIKKSMDLRPQ